MIGLRRTAAFPNLRRGCITHMIHLRGLRIAAIFAREFEA